MALPMTAREIMQAFARETGLTNPAVSPRRYLWTDAFAVCNFLELYRQSGNYEDLQLALQLVDQVHETLGKHHPESGKQGWLSGLPDEEAQRHPTLAGLRIGKQHNERQPDEPFDEQLEWERDGQYYHYLTKWMHALSRVALVTGRSVYQVWAMELAKTAHAAFVYAPAEGQPKRMFWKMSTDLSRPLVPSMGQHDPLDGLVTYLQLEAVATRFHDLPEKLHLDIEIDDLTVMCEGQRWVTQDALGIGGLLGDAGRLAQLIAIYGMTESRRLQGLLVDSNTSLQAFVAHHPLNLPAAYRLAFRELGLSIGLHAIDRMKKLLERYPENFDQPDRIHYRLESLQPYQPLQKEIETFWLEPSHREVNSWIEHADINNVMLATSLVPEGFLLIT